MQITTVRIVRFWTGLGGLVCFAVGFFLVPHIPTFFYSSISGIIAYGGGIVCLLFSTQFGKGAAAGLGTTQIAILRTLFEHPGATQAELRAALRSSPLGWIPALSLHRWLPLIVQAGLARSYAVTEHGRPTLAFALTEAGRIALEHSRL